MTAKKANKVYTVSRVEMESYLAMGYDIFDEEGKLLKRSPKATVPYSEYEKVVAERDELKAQLEKVKGDKFSVMEVEELQAYATEHSIDLGNATSKEGIIKKIKSAEAE